MDFLDDLIQILFDIIDELFWFSPELGLRKLKKLTVLIAILVIILFICLTYQIIIWESVMNP